MKFFYKMGVSCCKGDKESIEERKKRKETERIVWMHRQAFNDRLRASLKPQKGSEAYIKEYDKRARKYREIEQSKEKERDERVIYQNPDIPPLYRKHPDGTTDAMRYTYLQQHGMMPR